jgi:hypothetical protein
MACESWRSRRTAASLTLAPGSLCGQGAQLWVDRRQAALDNDTFSPPAALEGTDVLNPLQPPVVG